MRNEFPGEQGFSNTNVKYMRRWYEFYFERVINSQQLVDQFVDDYEATIQKSKVSVGCC